MFTIRVEGVLLRKGRFTEKNVSDVERGIAESESRNGYLKDFGLGLFGGLNFPDERWTLVIEAVFVDDKPFEADFVGQNDAGCIGIVNEPGISVEVSAVEEVVSNEVEFEGVFCPEMFSCVLEEGQLEALKYGDKILIDTGCGSSEMLGGYGVKFSYVDPHSHEKISREITIW